MYKKPNQLMLNHYTERYQRARDDGELLKCVIGNDSEYRINSRDSYYANISDPEIILEYVLYPQYVDGDIGVEIEIKRVLEQLAMSENALCYFQAFSFVSAEMMMKKYFGEIPFSVVSGELIAILKNRLASMSDKLQTYNEGDFGSYQNTMFDTVQTIIETCDMF